MATSSKDRLNNIKQEFIHELKGKISSREKSLADASWASDGSDFHKECRLEALDEIKFLKRVIKLIEK